MGYFDPPDDAEEEFESDDPVSDIVDELDLSSNVDDIMSEAEKRFDIASYYKEIIKSNIFSTDTEAAQLVSQEIRDFARSRMEVLLGMKSPEPTAQSVFSEDEIQALKALAGKVLSGPRLAVDVPKPKPEMLTIASPKEVAPTAPPRAISKQAAPKPSRPVSKAKNKPTMSLQDGKVLDVSTWPETKILQEVPVGKVFTYKGLHLVIDINKQKQHYIKNVTPQIVSPKAIPFPDKAGIEMATQSNASKSFRATERIAGGVANMAVATAAARNDPEEE